MVLDPFQCKPWANLSVLWRLEQIIAINLVSHVALAIFSDLDAK
jgi:hypothetical protein